VITSHLEFDLGQIALLSVVYRNNKFLLNRVDHGLVSMMCGLVEREGR
jgi:hypothetical protein